MALHQELAAGRWQTFTLAEQLGNIGSEINRALNWKERGNAARVTSALERGLELLDLTLADPRWRGRYKELARAREIACDYLAGENAYNSTPDALRKYFDAFALAAQR